MIADIGAKAFTAARLEFLNKLMGMGILKAVGDQKAEGAGHLADKQKVKLSQAARWSDCSIHRNFTGRRKGER